MNEVEKKLEEILDSYINDYGEVGLGGSNEGAMKNELSTLIATAQREAVKGFVEHISWNEVSCDHFYIKKMISKSELEAEMIEFLTPESGEGKGGQ